MTDDTQSRFDKLLKAMVEGEPPKGRKDAEPKVAKQKQDAKLEGA